jgi:hypothetical protein
LAAEVDRLEVRAVPSGTPINALPDVYSFDASGGSMVPPNVYPPNGFYINGALAGSLPAGYSVNRTLAGDFDGDGDQDVAAQVGTSWYVGLRSGGSFTFGGSAWGSLGGMNYTNWIVGDFYTGTPPGGGASSLGKEDIAVRDSSGQWQVAASTGTGFVVVATGVTWNTPTTSNPIDIQKGNFDGTGGEDIIAISNVGTQVSVGTNFWVMTSNGTGFANVNYTAPIAKTNYMGMYMNTGVNRALVGDFNGDGLSDVVAWNRYTNNANNGGMNKVWVGLSNGSSFNWGPIDAGGGNTEWGYINPTNVYSPLVGNFNGNTNASTGLPISDFVWFDLTPAFGPYYYGLMSNGVNAFNSAVTSPPTPGSPILMGAVGFAPLAPNGNPAFYNTVQVGDLNGDGVDDIFVGETNGTAFRLISTPGTPLPNGIIPFTLSRSYWMNWSAYPSTFRVFWVIGKYRDN